MKKFMDTFDEDHSGYVYVDGEEGDHGEILFHHEGVLVAKRIIKGGDNEWYEFTPAGKTLLLEKFITAIAANEKVEEQSTDRVRQS